MTSATRTCPSEALPLGALIARGAAYLARHGIPPAEARAQAEILAEEATGLRRARLLAHLGDAPAPAAYVGLAQTLAQEP